ncbi:hypothetical protein MKX01_005609 [Papaver californicum]|nr:hypothetical protein MKX01_005609 [Papaver californicum]
MGFIQVALCYLVLLRIGIVAAKEYEWKSASVTYIKDAEGSITTKGACGYGNLHMKTYGKYSAGLSGMLFSRGHTCGGCFEVRCVDHIHWCLLGSPSVTVTVTDFCAPNYGLPDEYGGWVNCERDGGVRFTLGGSSYFHQVFITNVGLDGEIVAVKVKGPKTGWIPMGRNWGQNWQCNVILLGQPLSFEVTSSSGKTVTSYNVAPPTWRFGRHMKGNSSRR